MISAYFALRKSKRKKKGSKETAKAKEVAGPSLPPPAPIGAESNGRGGSNNSCYDANPPLSTPCSSAATLDAPIASSPALSTPSTLDSAATCTNATSLIGGEIKDAEEENAAPPASTPPASTGNADDLSASSSSQYFFDAEERSPVVSPDPTAIAPTFAAVSQGEAAAEETEGRHRGAAAADAADAEDGKEPADDGVDAAAVSAALANNDDDESVGAESFRSCLASEEEEEKRKPPIVSMVVGTFSDFGVVIEREAGRLRTEDGPGPGGEVVLARRQQGRWDSCGSVISSVSSGSYLTACDASFCGSSVGVVSVGPGRSVASKAIMAGSAASCATGASYATALSRVSSKTDRVFVSMPRRLIRSGLMSQALSVLGDDRYVVQRIQKLGVVLAAELMALDCECYQKRAHRLKASSGGGDVVSRHPPESHILENLSITSGTTSKILALFDAFQRHVVSSCRPYLVPNAAASGEKALASTEMSPSEGGKALYMLGTSLDRRGVMNKAMSYYRHALGLFLAQVGDVGMQMFDDTRRELGLGPGVDYETIGDSAKSSGGKKLDYLDIGRTLTYVGDLHAKSGQLDDALKAYNAALNHFDRAVSHAVDCFNLEVRQSRSIGDISEPLTRALTGEVTKARKEFLWTLFRIGTVHGERNDVGASIAIYRRALMLEASLLGHDTVEVADTHYNLGSLYSRVANLDEALKHYQEALEIRRAILGQRHIDVARTLYNVGGVHRRRKDFSRAVKCFQEIVDTQESVLGKEHPLVKLATISLAATLRRSGDKEKALKLYSKASHMQS